MAQGIFGCHRAMRQNWRGKFAPNTRASDYDDCADDDYYGDRRKAALAARKKRRLKDNGGANE